MIFTKH